MVVAEALDFPGALSQGFDLADARRMIAAAIQELASVLLEQGQPLPQPRTDVEAPDADFIELIPLTVEVGTARP
jgi:predicted RNase H-like HicB family nuclease